MNLEKLRKSVGLAGVNNLESQTAQRWGRRYEHVMVFIVLWLIIRLYLEHIQRITIADIYLSDWGVWLFFIAETSTLYLLVKNKKEYLKNNWMNLIIILGSLPINSNYAWIVAILRSIQLIVLLRLLLPVWERVTHTLSRNSLGTTLLVCVGLTFFWGILMAAVDPNIHTPWDGIWWAWETVTTVGYGDVVPTSALGRFFSVLLMLFGVGIISLLTANFSAYFINKGTEKIQKEDKKINDQLIKLQKQLDRIEKQMNELKK